MREEEEAYWNTYFNTEEKPDILGGSVLRGKN
jgi:hypothetical protein